MPVPGARLPTALSSLATQCDRTLTDTAQPRYSGSEAELAKAARAIPLGRMAQPEEIARTALFLASDDAGFITGQTIHVSGGSYLA
jgi:acetoacetyl-CoA reductase